MIFKPEEFVRCIQVKPMNSKCNVTNALTKSKFIKTSPEYQRKSLIMTAYLFGNQFSVKSYIKIY